MWGRKFALEPMALLAHQFTGVGVNEQMELVIS
jgi:hypothetical protein